MQNLHPSLFRLVLLPSAPPSTEAGPWSPSPQQRWAPQSVAPPGQSTPGLRRLQQRRAEGWETGTSCMIFLPLDQASNIWRDVQNSQQECFISCPFQIYSAIRPQRRLTSAPPMFVQTEPGSDSMTPLQCVISYSIPHCGTKRGVVMHIVTITSVGVGGGLSICTFQKVSANYL